MSILGLSSVNILQYLAVFIFWQKSSLEILCRVLNTLIKYENVQNVLLTCSAHGTIYLLLTQSFQKTNISYPQIRNRTCEDQGVRYVSFSENFASLLNG